MLRFVVAVLAVAAASHALAAGQALLPLSQVTRAVGDEDCDVEAKDAFEKQQVFTLDADHKLVDVSCMRAAYNFASLYFLVTGDDAKSARRLDFKIWNGKAFVPSTTLTNGWYDAKTRILGSFDKGRGIGDCGAASEWAWDGKTFQMKGYWRKDRCDGEPFDFSSYESRWRIFPPR